MEPLENSLDLFLSGLNCVRESKFCQARKIFEELSLTNSDLALVGIARLSGQEGRFSDLRSVVSGLETRSAELEPFILYQLARIYERYSVSGTALTDSMRRGELLKDAAVAGCVDAQFEYAVLQNEGSPSITPDLDSYREWIRKAVFAGHRIALVYLVEQCLARNESVEPAIIDVLKAEAPYSNECSKLLNRLRDSKQV